MNAPPRMGIPLRPNVTALRRAGLVTLSRAAVAHIVAHVDGGRPDRIVARMFPNDSDLALLTRGAVGPISTTNASALLRQLTEYFISALSGVSAGAAVLTKTLQLLFGGNAVISVASFTADASGGGFVGEGMPIPSRELLAMPLLLEPATLKTISAVTAEMVSGSAGNAQLMIEDVLKRSVALALDAAMFDNLPAVADVRPAGLCNGVTPSVASAATNPTDAMIADIETLTAVVAAVSGTEPIILVASPARAKAMPLRSIALALSSSSFVILPSSAIAPAALLAIAPGALVSATDSVPEISVSRESVLHLSDTPQQLVTAGTPPTIASPSTSLFQTDALALRCRLPVSWAKRHPASVAWLSTTNW